MAVLSFDTLAATHSLERSGVPRAQAEGIADTVRQAADAWAANLATKDDLAVLRADMNTLRTEMKGDMNTLRTEMKGDMNTLRGETKSNLDALKAELFRALWVLGISMLTGVGVLLTMFRMV
ncbi:MAG: hypothetical protein OXR07_01560 [Nitrospira sp.]|nr:hypothetical protein [Nitrospira sp.]